MVRGGIKKYFLLTFLFLLCPLSTSAATLYLSPSAGSYAQNSSLSVSVYVKSTDKAMNAASGVVNFPADKLQVTSISKSGSVINLWVQEPAFSNQAGTVNFEGVALNPGYTGSNGKIITINFRVRGGGAGSLNISSASVLANDGQGTEILTGTGGAEFTLGEGKPVPLPVEPPPPPGKPVAPSVTSLTHPDLKKWYAIKDAKFAWNLPSDIIKARVLAEAEPLSAPTVVHSPAVATKEVKDVADGVWYFHVQLYNEKGWGGIAHFRFQIDTVSPQDLKVSEIKRVDLTEPRAAFTLSALDQTSGIDYYEIRVDNDKVVSWKDDESRKYETAALKPGSHILTVRAFDRAGNFALESLNFEVKPLAAPVIESYPETLRTGEILTITGKTYPSIQVVANLQRGAAEPVVTNLASDEAGRFVFAPSEELSAGNYMVWFTAVKDNGARSEPTKKFSVVVFEPAILRIGSFAVNVLSVIIPLITLIIILVLVIWYSAHRIKLMRKQLGAKIHEISLIRQAFELLRSDILKDIRTLERTRLSRELTAEEEKIINKLEQDMIAVDLILNPGNKKSAPKRKRIARS